MTAQRPAHVDSARREARNRIAVKINQGEKAGKDETEGAWLSSVCGRRRCVWVVLETKGADSRASSGCAAAPQGSWGPLSFETSINKAVNWQEITLKPSCRWQLLAAQLFHQSFQVPSTACLRVFNQDSTLSWSPWSGLIFHQCHQQEVPSRGWRAEHYSGSLFLSVVNQTCLFKSKRDLNNPTLAHMFFIGLEFQALGQRLSHFWNLPSRRPAFLKTTPGIQLGLMRQRNWKKRKKNQHNNKKVDWLDNPSGLYPVHEDRSHLHSFRRDGRDEVMKPLDWLIKERHGGKGGREMRWGGRKTFFSW